MEKHCDTLIKAAYILSQNAEREILTDAYIAIKNGKISALGPVAESKAWQADKEISLKQAMLLPGLHNAHTHVAMTFLRGLADDMPLMHWLNKFIFPAEKQLSAEIVELASLLGCAEMMKTGTTAFVDMYLFANSVAKAVDKAGMKALLGEVLFSFPSVAYGDVEKGFLLVEEMHSQWARHENIKVGIMPHTVYTTNNFILEKSLQISDSLNLPIHIHVAETEEETRKSMELYGMRPLELCEKLGLLSPKTNIAHAVDINNREIQMLASTGTRVSHCPKSNFKLASGFSPLTDLLKNRVKVGLGTDGAASNNTLNIFGEMNFCALVHKGLEKNSSAISAQDVLDLATLGGAEAMMSKNSGYLALGMDADLIAVSFDAPHMQPLYNPVSQLVYAASGHEVCLTMVKGKTLYRDGEFLSIDYEEIRREMGKLRDWVIKIVN